MEKDFNSQFNKLKENAKLSQAEKDFHRGEILKFIEGQPSPYTVDKKFPSPFYVGVFMKRHFVVTSVAVILLFGSGVTISADGSLPNDYLYQVKTKIMEPIEVFFTADKANIKVALVERRLEEFSQVALHEKISAKDKAAFVKQLAVQLEDTHQEIAKLKEEKNAGKALKTVNELQSVLEAQSTVLEKIEIAKEYAENTDDIENVINAGIEETTEIENDITDTIINSKDSENLEEAIIEEQKKEIQIVLESIKTNSAEPLLENTEGGDKLDIANQITIDTKLREVERNLKIATTEEETGKKIEALELYREIDQQLGELQKLIQADQKLKLR